MNSISLLPTVLVDFLGSALAIVLAFMALGYSRKLVRLEPDNFIWGFLWYLCIAMTVFSLSRGVGHIVRIVLVYFDQGRIWQQLSPLSGGINTTLMISVSAVIIYYHKGLEAYKAVRTKAEKLADANRRLEASSSELVALNTNLEGIVEDRTRDLSKSEKKFRNFFENSHDLIYFSDSDGTITDINKSGRAALRLGTEGEKINFPELFVDATSREKYLSELQHRGFVSDLEMECRGMDGSSRYILLTANAVYDGKGNIVGYEGIGKDMTRLRTMTEQLINHEKMASVGEMAAGVAHEINTPLGVILGYTQLMMDDVEEGSEFHDSLLVIERQSKACRRIVSDLLKFSRQAESAKSHINMNEVIEEVLAVLEHSLGLHGVTVERQFACELPLVYGDAEKLRQVFLNLVNNSQYAMPDGGKITIRTDCRAAALEIDVIDTGSGVPDEVKNRIFDPFFTTKEVGKGTGLGLSVTYGIIQEHGGTIEFESPVAGSGGAGENQGTVFHITLPVVGGAQASPAESA